jgi:hypothetical protein
MADYNLGISVILLAPLQVASTAAHFAMDSQL